MTKQTEESIPNAPQFDLFSSNQPPVLVAWGMGLDSSAMIVEMVESSQRIDYVLTADTGAEKPQTYAFATIFMEWLRSQNIPVEVVRYQPTNFKNYPPYRALDENCLTNGTLPSISFGFSSCSQKWKIAPQNKWAESWGPAQQIWSAGGKVIKLIGYDCSPQDQKRYAEREGHIDPRYHYRYPLREWGWTRDRCAARLREAGLPVAPKSACYMCAATKPHELHDMPRELLRRIVLIESRAAPRLRNVDGLWRKPVKGTRGGTARPGAMTDYIYEHELLSREEIDEIQTMAPAALLAFQDGMANVPIEGRTPLADWMQMFDFAAKGSFDPGGTPPLYAANRSFVDRHAA